MKSTKRPETSPLPNVRGALVPLLALLLLGACTGGEREGADWELGPSPDASDEETGIAPADANSDATGPGGPRLCDPDDPPRCEGGEVGYELTDAGCRTARCDCSDLERYDVARGECVNNVNPETWDVLCESDADCDKGVCDTEYLGTESRGRCIPTCEVARPEKCPDGWRCHVPGDVAGYCLPECRCDGPSCGPKRSCVGRESKRCMHQSNVGDWEPTCE